MLVTRKIRQRVERYRPKIRGWIKPFDSHIDDIVNDIYVRVLEAEEGSDLHLIIYGVCSDFRRKELNRRRLETENSATIAKNVTPTLSEQFGGSTEELVEAEQTLRARWATLSPLLKKIARRSFFGYRESPERIAEELGTSVAAVNMARTRIKQHMNGANDGRKTST